jgi:hypothetical protein
LLVRASSSAFDQPRIPASVVEQIIGLVEHRVCPRSFARRQVAPFGVRQREQIARALDEFAGTRSPEFAAIH